MSIRKAYNTGGEDMELQDQIIALRKETKMGRREFAEYFGIPYITGLGAGKPEDAGVSLQAHGIQG